MPQSRVFWLHTNDVVVIISHSDQLSDEVSLRQLLSRTDSFKEAILSRCVAQDFRILLKATIQSE